MAYDTDITKFSDDLNTIISPDPSVAYESAPVHRYGGRKRAVSGNFETATGDWNAGDIIVLARLPSNAVIHELLIFNDACDGASTLTVDIGVYEADGTAVNPDCYAADDTTFQSATAPSTTNNFRWDALTDPAGGGDQIWENAGESADPSASRDIAMTIVLAPATLTTPTVGYLITYTVD